MIFSREALKGIIFLSLGKILRVILGLFVGLYIMRELGPENYTKFQYLAYWSSILIVLIEFASFDVVQKKFQEEIPIANVNSDTFITKLFLLVLVSIVYFVFFLFSYNTHISISEATYYYPILVFSALNYGRYYFFYDHQTKFIGIGEGAAIIISSLIKIYVIYMKLEFTIFLFASTLEGLFLAIYFNIKSPINFKAVYPEKIKARLKEGFKPLGNDLLFFLERYLPLLLLTTFSKSEDITGLIIAFTLVDKLSTFAIPLIQYIYPLMLKNEETSHRYFFLFFGVGLFLSICINAFGANIILMVLGSKYEKSIEIFKILSWVLYYNFLKIYLIRLFFIKNHLSSYISITAINLFFMCCFAFFSGKNLQLYIYGTIFFPILLLSLFIILNKDFYNAIKFRKSES